ncbi:MAG: AI-2E family transporter [Clostridia bacterium]|nr:AI-2E family transporter [Clostridia bacterium]
MIQNKDIIKKFLICLMIILMVYLGMKYLVPLFIPFLLAGMIVLIIDPIVTWIHGKTRISKGLIAFIIMMSALILVFLCLWFLSSYYCFSFDRFLCMGEDWYHKCCDGIDGFCSILEKNYGINAIELKLMVSQTLEKTTVYIRKELTPDLLNHSFSYLKTIVIGIADLIIVFISVILIEKDLSGMKEQVKNNGLFMKAKEILSDCIKMIKVFMKAQLIIMGCVSILCIIFLFMIGYSRPILMGVVIAFLDLLPFIGTSLVLLPWIFFAVLNRNYYCAFMLLVLLIAASSVREILEPRLIGKRMGVFPIIIMISIYVGIKLFGFMGIIYGPISLILIDRLIKAVVIDK